MLRLKPPRSAFLNFPLGHQCGKVNDRDLQLDILKASISLLETATTPGEIVDLPFEWGEPFSWQSFMSDLDAMLKEEGSEVQKWTP